MQKSLFLFLFLCIGLIQIKAVDTSPQFIQGNDTLVVYQDVPGLTPSDKYTIRVRSAATNNVWVDVFAHYTYNRAFELERINRADGTVPPLTTTQHYANFTSGWSHSYGNIEMSKNTPVEVEIAAKTGFTIGGQNFFKATVHPAQKASVATMVDGKVYFTITNPGQLVIDINGQMDDYNAAINPIGHPVHAISLFANPVIKKPTITGSGVYCIEAGTDSASMSQINPATFDTLYFKPGVHNIGKDFKIHPGKTYYIPGDAMLYGNLSNLYVPRGSYATNGENIHIYGYGTLSQAKITHPDYVLNPTGIYLGIYIENGLNWSIRGVCIADPSNHSTLGTSSASGLFSWMKVISWRANGDGLAGYCLAEDCFIRTQDDCSYVKGNKRRCTFWKDANAALFHMAGIPENTVEPIIIEDCDVIYNRLRDKIGLNGGGFQQRGSGTLGQRNVNVIFRNFRFHDKLINMPVFSLASGAGSSYNGILFQNISIAGMAPGSKQQILGSATAPWYGGLTFDNITINDTLLTSSNFSHFFKTNEYVSDVIFKNSPNYTLTINNSADGTVVPSSSLENYADSTVISLTAVAKFGYAFKSWSGDVTGSSNPTTFAIRSNMTVSAIYQRANSYTSTTPGSSSWIVPQGVDSITINVWGAGGAGGSAQLTDTVTANTQIRAGGGAGGSYASSKIAVTPGQVISYTVGAGAIAPVSGFANDAVSNGGNTSCGSILAVGGTGGKSKTIAVAGFPNGTGGIAPTTGNTGTVNYYGGNGGNGGTGSGGGGGSAGSAGNGGNSTNDVAGIAGIGGGAAGAAGTISFGAVGRNGFVPGSGGSGGIIRYGTTPTFNIGGRGGNGKLLIMYTINQSITFPALATKTVGNADFNPGATASSGLAVTYTSSNTAVATILNGNIHIVGAGTTTITASQSGDATYNAAADVVQALTVKINQTITFPALASKASGDADFSAGATASSGLAVTYTSSKTAVAIIVGGSIRIVGAGTANITASQAGNASYNAAANVVQTLTVNGPSSHNPYSQIEAENYNSMYGVLAETCAEGGKNVGSISNGDYIVFNNVDFGVGASGFEARVASLNAGGTIEIRLDNLAGTLVGTGIVTNTGGWQTWTTINSAVSGATGVHNLYLKFTGGAGGLLTINWFKFIAKQDQTITFPVLAAKTIGDADFNAGATASSGLAVSYTSSNTAVATIVGGNIHIVGAGTTNITASQAGNASYNAAASMVNVLTVSPIPDVTALTPWTLGTTLNKVNGSNRLLVVMVMGESNADFSATGVTYGGQAMTKQTEKMYYVAGNRSYASVFTLKEAGVNAATSGAIAVTWSATPSVGHSIYSVLLSNVDQTTPVSAVANNSLTGTTVTTSALATASGDMVIMCGATENNTTITFNNGFLKQFETNTTWGDGLGGNKMATGVNETPSFTQSASGRMALCAVVVKKTTTAMRAPSKNTNIIEVANTNANENIISIYPNPVSTNLHVDFSNADISREIRVFNVFGQLVYNTKTQSTNVQINVQKLNLKGVLMVQVIEGNSVVSHKVLVK